MAAPSYNYGITQLGLFTLAPSAISGTVPGTTGNGNGFSNGPRVRQTSVVINTRYGGSFPLSATISTGEYFAICLSNGNFTADNARVAAAAADQGAFLALLGDGPSYVEYAVSSGDASPALSPVTATLGASVEYPCLIEREANPRASSGSFNWSITSLEVFFTSSGGTTHIGVMGAYSIATPTVSAGDSGDPVTFAKVATSFRTNALIPLLFERSAGNYAGLGNVFISFLGITFNNAYIRESVSSLVLHPVTQVGIPNRQLHILNPRVIRFSGTSDTEFFRCNFFGGADDLPRYDVEVLAGTHNWDEHTIWNAREVTLDVGSYPGLTCDGNGTLNVNSTTIATLTDAVFRNAPDGDGVIFTGAPGDYSGVSLRFNNNSSTADLTISPSSAGEFDFSGVTVPSGYTLKLKNLSGTHAITIVIGAGITASVVDAGAGLTVVTPQVSLSAPNFANGTRFFAARQQSFAIQSADINTTQNTITLGNDDETGAAFAGQSTSPATLALLTLATGATIPTTSPQIVDGNLYYVVANTSGVIEISESEGGAAIDFTNTGTQNGGGELFSLRCETELINQVVSGGAGVSQALTLPNDAILNVAAIHRASASSCSTLFERQLQWSSTTGATIPDTFSATNNPDTIHNSLVGATIRSKSGLSVSVSSDGAYVTGLSFDLSGNIELDANAITDNTMSFPDGYLWAKFIQSTEVGIRFIRNQFSAVGIMDYRFDKLRLDNVADGVRNSPATTLTIYGNVEPTTPGQSVIASGSGTVHIIPFYVSDIESSAGGSGDATAANQTAIINALAVVDGIVDSILEDTSTTLPALIGALPTVAQLEARTLPSDNYFVVGDYTAPPDISGLLTTSAYTASLPANFADLAITATTGLVTTTNPGGGATAAEVWGYAGRALDGAQASALVDILEDTSTTIPALIAVLPTVAQVEAAGFTTTRHNALIATETYTRPMAKQLGLVAGITATHAEAGITISDGDGSTTITDNNDGSYTVGSV